MRKLMIQLMCLSVLCSCGHKTSSEHQDSFQIGNSPQGVLCQQELRNAGEILPHQGFALYSDDDTRVSEINITNPQTRAMTVTEFRTTCEQYGLRP